LFTFVGASRGYLCDSTAFLSIMGPMVARRYCSNLAAIVVVHGQTPLFSHRLMLSLTADTRNELSIKAKRWNHSAANNRPTYV